MRGLSRACLVGLLGGAVLVPLAGLHASAPAPLPETLEATGLYSDWTGRVVDARHLPYAPQYPLWTDGAEKSRWLSLPPGATIDASDPDTWEFPVGTRVWKEFRFHGQPAETRYIERAADGWRYASYVWKPDGTARLTPARGVLNSVEISPGVRHAIPSRTDCTACHEAGPSRLLSVSALQLSDDRDPDAPHAEAVPSGGVTLGVLQARGLLRGLPTAIAARPPRIDAPTPVARAALGYLHANCGMCHTGAGEIASLGFSLQHRLAADPALLPDALRTTVGIPSHFRSTLHPSLVDRIAAGDASASLLLARMASRHPVLQMPPLGSRLVDTDAVALLRRWIDQDTTRVLQTRASTR